MDSDESDADYEVIINRFIHRRPRVLRERKNFFTYYDDEDFRLRFRVSKRAAWIILENIRHKIMHNSTK